MKDESLLKKLERLEKEIERGREIVEKMIALDKTKLYSIESFEEHVGNFNYTEACQAGIRASYNLLEKRHNEADVFVAGARWQWEKIQWMGKDKK